MGFLKKFLGTNDLEYEEDAIVDDRNAEPSQTQTVRNDGKKSEFLLVKPASRDELAGIADNLMLGKTVVLNLELITKDNKRFVDFLSGLSYALKGKIKKIAEQTYLIIPGGVDVSGDIFDDFEDDSFS